MYLDNTNITMKKKIRNMQIMNYNFAAVIGEEEVKAGVVDVRTRANERLVKFIGVFLIFLTLLFRERSALKDF